MKEEKLKELEKKLWEVAEGMFHKKNGITFKRCNIGQIIDEA